MSDFEPFDDELAAAFRRRAAGGPTSTAGARDAVVRRAGAIRRRRATIGGSVAMVALLVGGFALLPRDADEVGPAVTGDVLPSLEDPSTTIAATNPVDSTTEDASPAIVDVSIPPVSAPTSVQDTVASEPTATAGPSSPSPTSSVAATVAPSSSSTSTAPSTSVPSSSTPSASAPEPTLAPFTNTYHSAGGSITVSWSGSALTLEAASPEPGFVADVEDSSATRIRVRFEGESDDSRIEVRVSDGQVLVDID